jgi:hypothetical protein
VAEFVEHGVEHLVVGDEVVVAARASQPQLDLHPLVDVEPQQRRVPRPNHKHAPPGRRGGSFDRSVETGGRAANRSRGGRIGLGFVGGAGEGEALTRTRRGP